MAIQKSVTTGYAFLFAINFADTLEEEEKEEEVLYEYPFSNEDNSSLYLSDQFNKPKERVPVFGHVYLVKSPELNLYGFRISKGDIHPDTYAQLTFYQKKNH